MKNLKKIYCAGFLWIALSGAMATPPVATGSRDNDPVSSALFEQRLQVALVRGQADTPQLRETIKQDLINRQLLLKEAQRQGIDKDAAYIRQFAIVREDMMADWLLQKQSNPASISAAEIKAEYDRQVKMLGTATDLKEYELHLIISPSKDMAGEVIKELNNGVSFEKVAREKSIDSSRAQGGMVGWVLPQLITPNISGVMENLSKGATSAIPIETPSGWAVIRVNDIRPYRIPTLEESHDRLLPAVVLRKRIEFIQGLRQAANMKP